MGEIKVRLIDADALIQKRVHAKEYDGEMYVIGQGYIMDAPTVDAVPVVHGEWLVTDAYPHRVYCSICYKTNVPNEEILFEKNEYPEYCMWCGAKMKERESK